ncbi:hypothetical protein D7Y38_21650, partial [Stenotrophomonas maltophilia]|nr:hypothetical protein [Stenotrophomonas maltophilia]
AYMDVLAASPATGPTPPIHGMPAFAFAFAFAVAVAVAVAVEAAGQRPALPQVQGCKPCRTTLNLRSWRTGRDRARTARS